MIRYENFEIFFTPWNGLVEPIPCYIYKNPSASNAEIIRTDNNEVVAYITLLREVK